MATTNNTGREMGKYHVHQLDAKKEDTVMITAISQSDNLHDDRHNILFREAKLISNVRQAKTFGGQKYANWVTLAIKMNGKKYFFNRCQIKLVSKSTRAFPATMTIREKLLDRINAELNHTKLKDPRSIEGGPKDEYDIKGWWKLFNNNHIVQARYPHSRQWFRAGIQSFHTKIEGTIFRLKAKDD